MPKRVRIVGDHPHRGESGTVRDDKPMRLDMWQVDLDPGSTTRGCFAGAENLRPLSPEEDSRELSRSETSGQEPPKMPPKAPAGTDDHEPRGFPRELYAPAVEGPIIRPKSKPRIVREES